MSDWLLQRLACRTSIPSHVVSTELDGEIVLLSLESGRYYGLDAVASWIWAHIAQGGAVGDILSATAEEFAVDQERCERDIVALLQRLLDEKLIEVDDARVR